MAVQNSLLTVPPEGVWFLRAFLPRAEQEKIREELRAVVKAAPLYRPTRPYGAPYLFKVTNCGEYGWTSEEVAGVRFTRQHPKGRVWPPIPPTMLEAASRAAAAAGCAGYAPNTCLISVFEPGSGSDGPGRADTNFEEPGSRIVSLSLGSSYELGVGGKESPERVAYDSGDALVLLPDDARPLYTEVRELKPGCDLLDSGVSIIATFRRVEAGGRRRPA